MAEGTSSGSDPSRSLVPRPRARGAQGEDRLLSGPPVTSLEEHLERGGGQALTAARALGADAVVDVIARSGLRGRGGAGFPTGRKWRSLADATGGRRFVVANGAEGEPGTWKDRAVLRHDPWSVLEGVAIAAHAIGAGDAYVATKASYTAEVDALTAAAEGLTGAGMLGELAITIVRGPDAYLYGEETALLEVIEGGDPLPRVLAPYQQGLFAGAPRSGWGTTTAARSGGEVNPTLVNNVETLAHAAWILRHGPDAFRELGTDDTPGTLLVTVAGDVVAPGVFEVAAGTPLRAVIERAGGVAAGRAVQVVLAGVAVGALGPAELDLPLAHDAFRAAGSGLGSAGFLVFDDTACVVDVARRASRFLATESCGQCPPCKLGSTAISEVLDRLVDLVAEERELGEVQRWLGSVTDGARCALAAEERDVVSSLLRGFPEEFARHLEGRCTAPRRLHPGELLARPPW
jgi:NADH-quinone oxidoreductase subunit F